MRPRQLGDLARRARRAGCAGADARRPADGPAAQRSEPVPAPQPPVAVDQALAGREAAAAERDRPLRSRPSRPARGCARAPAAPRPLPPADGRPRAKAGGFEPGRFDPNRRRRSRLRRRCKRRLEARPSNSCRRSPPRTRPQRAAEDSTGRPPLAFGAEASNASQRLGFGFEPRQRALGVPRRVESSLLSALTGRDFGFAAASTSVRHCSILPLRLRQTAAAPVRASGVTSAAAKLARCRSASARRPSAGRRARRGPCGADRARRGAPRRRRRLRSSAATPLLGFGRVRRCPIATWRSPRDDPGPLRLPPGASAWRSSDNRDKRRLSLGKMRVLAVEIGRSWASRRSASRARRQHTCKLLLEPVARMGQPLQLGRGRGLGMPQRRQCCLRRFAGSCPRECVHR